MSDPILLYGATGYTASLIIDEAVRAGLRPVLGGRSKRRLEQVATPFDLETRAAAVHDAAALAQMLRGIAVLINAAGPFVDTAAPLIAACIEAGVHYLDISGEVPALEAAAAQHAKASQRGVMILPATGFDVVPSDCLCASMARELPRVRTLRIGVSGLELMTRGSARTLARELGAQIRVRQNGVLVSVPPGTRNHRFDVGDGSRSFTAVTWGDLVTAYYTTGVSNIETYFDATPAVMTTLLTSRYFGPLLQLPWMQQMLERQAEQWAFEPDEQSRASRRIDVVVEGETASGHRHTLHVNTPEAYTLTAQTSVAIAQRVLAHDVEPGFQTPARVFGPELIWQFAGVTRPTTERAHAT